MRESESHLFNRPPFDAVNADLYGGNQVPRLAHREGLGGPTSFPATAAHGIAHASNTRHAGPSPTLPTVLSMSAPIACRRGGAFRRGGARSSRATKKASDRPTSTGVPSRAHHGGYTNKRGETQCLGDLSACQRRALTREAHARTSRSIDVFFTHHVKRFRMQQQPVWPGHQHVLSRTAFGTWHRSPVSEPTRANTEQ